MVSVVVIYYISRPILGKIDNLSMWYNRNLSKYQGSTGQRFALQASSMVLRPFIVLTPVFILES